MEGTQGIHSPRAGGLEYYRPRSVEEAIRLLTDLGEEAMLVGGATDVWVEMRSGKLTPKALVSLRGVGDLRYLEPEGSALTIGAGTRHADVEDSEWVAGNLPALHQACSGVGSRQIRNVATVGGNLCNAAPCADSAVGLLLYDAVAVTQGPAGSREIPLKDFFVAPGLTVLEHGEILARVEVPDSGPRTYAGYWKHTRRRGIELPMLGVGARITFSEDGETVEKSRIALGVAGPTPRRMEEAEAVMEGFPLTEERVLEAARMAAYQAEVRDSFRGKAWYRREMIRVLIPRVLRHAGALEEVTE